MSARQEHGRIGKVSSGRWSEVKSTEYKHDDIRGQRKPQPDTESSEVVFYVWRRWRPVRCRSQL